MDLGFDKRWDSSSLGAVERVVVERFLSWSERDGFLWFDCEEV